MLQLIPFTEGPSTLTTELLRPVVLTFFVSVEFLESSIALGFLPKVDHYYTLSDKDVLIFFNDRAKECKGIVTLEKLDEIISRYLRINIRNSNATACMQNLLASYHTIIARNGLKWIIKENQKVAVQHLLLAMQPLSLWDRPQSDLEHSHHALRKNFTCFQRHAIKLAEAFQIFDNCQPSKNFHCNERGENWRVGQSRPGKTSMPKSTAKSTENATADTPVCLWNQLDLIVLLETLRPLHLHPNW